MSLEELAHIHAATDVTGFGLAGHSYQMAKASEVSLRFNISHLPFFKNTFDCLEKGFLTKAHRSNEEYTKGNIHFSGEISEIARLSLFDPQTSGGLLLCADIEAADQIVARLANHFPGTAIVGEVIKKEAAHVYVE